jgi:hypothetical protein
MVYDEYGIGINLSVSFDWCASVRNLKNAAFLLVNGFGEHS